MQIKMDPPNIVSSLAPPRVEIQVLEIDSSHYVLPGNKAGEHNDSNAMNGRREEVEIEVRDSTSLYPQTSSNQTCVLAKDNHQIGFPENPTAEEQEIGARMRTNQPDEIGSFGSAFPPSGPPAFQSDIQAVYLKIGLKVSSWVSAISAAGIITVLVGYLGNHSSLNQKPLFKACLSSLCGSFVSGIGLFLLSIIRPNFFGLIPTVKIMTWISLGMMTLTVGIGTSILFNTN